MLQKIIAAGTRIAVRKKTLEIPLTPLYLHLSPLSAALEAIALGIILRKDNQLSMFPWSTTLRQSTVFLKIQRLTLSEK